MLVGVRRIPFLLGMDGRARHTKGALLNTVARFQQSAAMLSSVLLNQMYLKEDKSARDFDETVSLGPVTYP